MLADEPDVALEQLQRTREQLHDSWANVLSTTDAVLALDGRPLAALSSWPRAARSRR